MNSSNKSEQSWSVLEIWNIAGMSTVTGDYLLLKLVDHIAWCKTSILIFKDSRFIYCLFFQIRKTRELNGLELTFTSSMILYDDIFTAVHYEFTIVMPKLLSAEEYTTCWAILKGRVATPNRMNFRKEVQYVSICFRITSTFFLSKPLAGLFSNLLHDSLVFRIWLMNMPSPNLLVDVEADVE